MKNVKIGTLILLIGAFLRLFGLVDLGLEHDEVANWLIGRDILSGHHALYFSQYAYGHEAGFHYIQAVFIQLIGDHALALRLPAAFLSILCIATTYRLNRTLFTHKIALIASLFVAITFFPAFYGRLALRATMLPVLSAASATLFWRGLHSPFTIRNSPFTILAGFLAGLTLHTYMASRVVPIFYALFIAYLIVVDRPLIKRQWRGLVLFTITFVITAAPLFIHLALNPNAAPRVDQVNAPLQSLYAGDFMPVLRNIRQIIGVFGWSGDPLWRQNVAGSPIFNPLTALLFYTGIFIALWRHKKAHIFALLWLTTATIPSIVTVDAPSTIRMINMLPFLGLFPALALSQLCKNNPSPSPSQREGDQKPPSLWGGLRGGKWFLLTLTIITTWGIGRTTHYTHNIWPISDEIPFVWQTALTDAGRYLDTAAPIPTTILGWSPDTLPGDVPTMALAMQRDDIPLRFAGSTVGARSLIIPSEPFDGAVRVVRPTTPLYPLATPLEQLITDWNGSTTTHNHFITYEFTPNLTDLQGEQVTFGDELTFLGYKPTVNGDNATILTFWRVERKPRVPDEARKLFLHVLAADNTLLRQSDGLDAPTSLWQVGDLIVHVYEVNLADAADIRLGVYVPQEPYPRLTAANGNDTISLEVYP